MDGSQVQADGHRHLPNGSAVLGWGTDFEVAAPLPIGSGVWVGDWLVDLTDHSMSRDGESVKLEARLMRLLARLIERSGDVVGNAELLDHVWPATKVSPDSLYQAVASLRRLLRDDPKQPRYIETVPRQGYRLIVTVRTIGHSDAAAEVADARPRRRPRFQPRALIAGTSLLACAAIAIAGSNLSLQRRHGPPPTATRPAAPVERGVAVLPFHDLTGRRPAPIYFADGMTEELIDRISHVNGICVSASKAASAFRGRDLPVEAIARALQVDYILDGSVRRSGATLRVSAQLVRADGFIVWTETYDRPARNSLAVQDDIASHVVGGVSRAVAGDARRSA